MAPLLGPSSKLLGSFAKTKLLFASKWRAASSWQALRGHFSFERAGPRALDVKVIGVQWVRTAAGLPMFLCAQLRTVRPRSSASRPKGAASAFTTSPESVRAVMAAPCLQGRHLRALTGSFGGIFLGTFNLGSSLGLRTSGFKIIYAPPAPPPPRLFGSRCAVEGSMAPRPPLLKAFPRCLMDPSLSKLNPEVFKLAWIRDCRNQYPPPPPKKKKKHEARRLWPYFLNPTP